MILLIIIMYTKKKKKQANKGLLTILSGADEGA